METTRNQQSGEEEHRTPNWEILRELEHTIKLWQQSKYYKDLQAWREQWWRENG